MARRTKDDPLGDLYRLLLAMPWWCVPVLAALVFLVLRFLLPAFLRASPNPVLAPTIQMLRMLSTPAAPVISLFILAIWICAEVGKFIDRKRLDSQTGIASIRQLSWHVKRSIACCMRRFDARVMPWSIPVAADRTAASISCCVATERRRLCNANNGGRRAWA